MPVRSWLKVWCHAGARINSNAAASTSDGSNNGFAIRNGSNGSYAASQLPTPKTDARFEDPVGRRDPRVAQVALDPASTPIIDLNAATFQAGGSPNRISLADLLHNDGAWQPHSLSFCTVALPQLAANFLLL